MSATEFTRLQAALAGEAPLNWVLTGDSITHGLVHTQGGRSYPEHMHELVRGELERTRDVLVTTAISGHRLTDILGDWNRRVSAWSPHIVTLMIGTNDCASGAARVFVSPEAFGTSLGEFVTRVREAGAIPVLQTPPPVDAANAPERSRIGEFVAVIRAVAAHDDVLLVDNFARFAELGSGGMPWGLMNDPFHPNAAGHAAIALELAATLGLTPTAPSRTLLGLQGRVAAARLAL